jgi:hypothetical protein
MEACWRSIGRVEATVKQPGFGENEAGHRPILRHGTHELGPVPVAEQVIGTTPELCCREHRRSDERHVVPPEGGGKLSLHEELVRIMRGHNRI